MRLTKSADYGLRIVIHLAQTGHTQSIKSLAGETGISYHHLVKIVQSLVKGAYLRTHQGKLGGVELAKPAASIKLRDIVDLIDGPTKLADCLDDDQSCKLYCDCKLRTALSDIQNEINGLLEKVTIKELM